LGPVRVVIVEDYEPWRRAIISILEEEPALEIVYAASDGLEGVQRCLELKPDLVLLDVSLPKLNGLEAGRQIREALPDTKLLFLSLHLSHEVVREAVRIGAAGYIAKVDALRELLPAVRAIIANEEFVRFRCLPASDRKPPQE
jgi:DNA-binding NarL/FixJ family response regulator